MTPKALFRTLIVASLFGYLAGILVVVFPGPLSEDWETLLEWNGNSGIYETLDRFLEQKFGAVALIALLLACLSLDIAVWFGLFFFWRWARLGNLLLTALFLLLTPWSGLVISLPLEAAIYDFTSLSRGAVIAMSYLSPIKELFTPQRIT